VGWTFGLVLSYSLGSVLPWNWLAFAGCAVPVVQFTVLATSEDSPRWLVSRGQLDEAKKALIFFRGSSLTNMSKHVECELKVGWANIRHIFNTRRSALQISANHVFKKKFKKTKTISKQFLKFFREIFFSKFFWAITVPHPIWSMPAKIGGSRPAGLGGDRECTDST
jgi:hypothetical protein